MKKGSFLKMLNKVLPDRSYFHENQHGLCNWVFKSMPPGSHSYLRGTCLDDVIPATTDMFAILSHFVPTWDDFSELRKNEKSDSYWASESASGKCGELTPLRETILLFCAALNNEL